MESECILPPQVCGHPNGELIVKVDEVFWSKKSPGDVFIHLQWWGEKNYNIFWPIDINQKGNKEINSEKQTTVTYTLRTSPALFETYIKNCGKLTFYIVKESDRTIVGTSVINDLADTLRVQTYSSLSSYYPIYNLQRNRIGDLRISFSIYLKKKLDGNEKLTELPKLCPLGLPTSNKGRKPVRSKNKGIAEIVSKSQELRKAMVKSVLKDVPINKVESIINAGQGSAGDSKMLSINENNVQLMGLIMGKNLSESEAEIAEKTLQCLSSSESLTMATTSHDYTALPLTSDKSQNEDSIYGDFTKSNENKDVFSNLSFKEDNTIYDDSSIQVAERTTHIEEINNYSSPTPIETVAPEYMEHKAVGKWLGHQKVLQSMDCFRFTVCELKLNAAGAKKVSFTPALKPTEKQIRVANPPGILFSIEFSLPVRTVHRTVHKPTVFLSKRYHGNDAIFGDCVDVKLPEGIEFPWLKVSRLCGGGEIKVYWRHLNQRLPSYLGSAAIPELNSANCSMEELASTLNLSMPVISSTKLSVGKLVVCIELGRNFKAFGENLFNALANVFGNKMKPREKAINQIKF